MISKFTFPFLVLVFCAAGLSGQVPFMKKINVAEEIKEGHINKVTQTADGFIWLATTNGLYKYDGFEFHKISRTSNKEYRDITSIYEDANGLIWLGFANGNIATLQNEKFNLFHPEEGLPKARITDILTDDENNLWFATYGEGIYFLKNERLYLIDREDGLKDEYIYDLQKDPSGNIWAASDGGIAVCNIQDGQKKIRNIDTRHGLPDVIVTCLAGAGDRMYVGMQDKGVAIYDLVNQRFLESPSFNEWPFGRVNAILPFQDFIWAGTENNGIIDLHISGGGFRQYAGELSKIGGLRRITDIYRCKEDNIWIAGDKKLILSTGEKLKFISQHEDVDFSNPLALLVDSKKNVWFSNNQGLYRHKSTFTQDEDLSKYFGSGDFGDYPVMSLFEDKRGLIWAGTFGNGIYILDPEKGSFIHFTREDGLINNNVLSIDGRGNEIWFATLGGVEKCLIPTDAAFEKGAYEFTGFTSEHGLGNNFVYCVKIDAAGEIWFGTDGNGITCFKGDEFVTYNENSGLQSNVVYSIVEDNEGNIWFSTADAGLYQYNGNSFVNYGLQEGLRDLNIWGLETAPGGQILIAHDVGIDLLDPARKVFSYYGGEVGIMEMNPNLNAITGDAEGNIWLGAQNGILRFHPPENIARERPETRITGLSVYLEPVQMGEREFTWNENHITFSYIGLWYIAPEKVKYQVMLEGHDIDWMETQNRFITYSNLSPGKYIFKLRSGLDGNFRDENIKTYEFTIRPPYWATYWFYLLLFVLIVGLVYFYIKFREKRLRRQEMLKKEKLEFEFQTLKNQVNPHFLFNSFSTLISLIEDKREEAVEYVEKLSAFFRNILQYRDMEVISLEEELKIIQSYFYIQQKRYGNNLKYSVEIAENYLHSLIPPLTLQMLVENAIKHNVISRSKPLQITIHITEGMLAVENNLQAKKSREISTGLGLQNIRDRYKILTGKDIKIEKKQHIYRILLPVIKSK